MGCGQGAHAGHGAPMGAWQGAAPPDKGFPFGFPAALAISRGLVAFTLGQQGGS